MDDHWHYAENSERSYGPMNIEDLGRILRSRDNAANFLVWCPGMQNWARAGDQVALQRFFGPPPMPGVPAPPPPPPNAGLGFPSTPPQVQSGKLHPWRRYFARTFDLVFFCFVFFFVFAFIVGLLSPQLLQGIEKVPAFLYGIAGTVLYAPFEAFALQAFGTTLGRKLYGIRLSGPDGDRLPFSLALKRSATVSLKGMGLGLPIVALITTIVGYQTLTKEGQTSWDRDYQCTVSHKELSGLRWVFIVLAWIVLLAVYIGLTVLGAAAS